MTPMHDPPKPKVAVILSGYGEVPRGAEALLSQWLPRLEERLELHTYSRSGEGPGGKARPAIARSSIEKMYLATRSGRKVLDTLYLEPIHLEWTSHLLTSLPALIRGRYDVIWHETGLWGGYLLSWLRRATGVRLLDVAHSNQLGWEVPFARRRPDIFVAQSDSFAEQIRSEVPGLRVEVVRQGVDGDFFRPGVERYPIELPRPVVLVVGALSPEKAPDLAIEAVARTRASLVLAGDGPLAPSMDALARERLGPDRYQRLTLERAEMPSLYAAADLLLAPSPREAGPLAALEAMACNKPVVATADSARLELVGDGGILVEGVDPQAFADAIEQALELQWGDRPRRQALSHSVDDSAKALGDLLYELARKRP
ncbi:MAG: glycosyltransferase [Nitrospirae bacterium]|nr:glycosyltransferase [Nitrospirota bacterium]